MNRRTSPPRAHWMAGSLVLLSLSAAVPQIIAAESSQAGANTAAAPRVLRGYAHDLSRSRFKIGQNAAIELDAPRLRRWRGSLGAWAIDPTNNWSMGLLDSTTPVGPYILDEGVHSALVKKYFIEAGIPSDQIRDVRATYQVIGGGPFSEAAQFAPIQLQSITSILTRAANGIPVAESLAWARMTTAGDVDMECVFWPSIDMDVVTRATALAQRLSDPAAHAAYLAKLPGKVYRDAGVVIHHSDSSIHATPTAYVSYDVTLSAEGHSAVRHFDENGVEFRLPQENSTPAEDRVLLKTKPQPQ